MKKFTKFLALGVILAAPAFAVIPAEARCMVKWVDHDFNVMTRPIQKQVCDSTLDLPGINLPGVQPIQRPQIPPLPSIGLPPIGATSCTMQSVYENGAWVTRRLCR
jgi:hypothetical protein